VNRAIVCALLALGVASAAAGTGSSTKLPWGDDPPAGPAMARAAAISALGRSLFLDPALSGSGAMSCATCHSPANHFAPTNDLSVQLGGARLNLPGTRATPSLAYTATTPFFTEHYYDSDDDGNESVDEGPTGGRTWDGRVNRPSEQAAVPLLASNEMNNASEAEVVAHVAAAPYAPELGRLYGKNIFNEPHKAFAAVGEALEAYQETPQEFSPFTSKYDAFLRGETKLTLQEARGLAAFNDPSRGNCNKCHRSLPSPIGRLPLFTDFGYVAVGAPRNRAIAANADQSYFDLGVCGPQRKDLANRTEFCGLFKTPSLRNVATRKSYYHNGVFHTLEDAVAFYATRDTDPERWYPVGPDGKVRKFDDLPARYQGNVSFEPPFGKHPGEPPTLTPDDVADIVAFLRTLTDGFSQPGHSQTAFTRTGPH
jgi:cytochrome c peroxidase